MLGWGFADYFAKKTIDQIGDIVSLVWAHVFGTCGFLVLALATAALRAGSVAVPSDPSTWALLALFGILQAAVYLLVYIGFGKGQLALLNPIFASFSGITAVVSIAAFGEPFSALRALAVARQCARATNVPQTGIHPSTRSDYFSIDKLAKILKIAFAQIISFMILESWIPLKSWFFCEREFFRCLR